MSLEEHNIGEQHLRVSAELQLGKANFSFLSSDFLGEEDLFPEYVGGENDEFLHTDSLLSPQNPISQKKQRLDPNLCDINNNFAVPHQNNSLKCDLGSRNSAFSKKTVPYTILP